MREEAAAFSNFRAVFDAGTKGSGRDAQEC